jgi:hypothetical protein
MQVIVTDNPANWMKWGALVRSWVFGETPLPTDTAKMQQQMADKGIGGSVPGPVRPVSFVPYNDGTPLIFPLPTQAMVLKDEAELKQIAQNPPGQRLYPIPSFYATAFGGAAKVDLTEQQLVDFGSCRLGEYTIQECM